MSEIQMELRPYFHDTDFQEIKDWISDERTHALWSAMRFDYPLEKDNFACALARAALKNGDAPMIATVEDGKPAGFFCYSLNSDTGEVLLKFIVVNPAYRGKGIAVEMLRRAAAFVFENTNAIAVQLNVFSVNERAKRCYEKAGFTLRKITEKAYPYQEEIWDRCNMVLPREK